MSHSRSGERGKRRERPVETFTTGLAFSILFGVLLGVNGAWFWVLPLVFVGILPMVRGITALVGGRAARSTLEETRSGGAAPAGAGLEARGGAERQILLVAKEQGGTVTPALIALKTPISLDIADQMLQDMARRGHATMNVADDGRLEYRFPDLAPRDGPALPPGRDA